MNKNTADYKAEAVLNCGYGPADREDRNLAFVTGFFIPIESLHVHMIEVGVSEGLLGCYPRGWLIDQQFL